ncbi:MAG: acetyl-CoA carboxylase biotin carboxylase subunit [Deltaproteobacteria bacterium]|nr:acetyl-CoA carboxylase biotin carboxylase subunit [Deltaproteobacteria bacterium]
MPKKLLVANRGEIAVRVLRACAELAIPSVAVFSDADCSAPHAMLADEAVRLGEAEAKSSYLDIGKIIDAAQTVGADAIHPGYGFLSESAQFAAACQAAGITFVGPSAATIEALGDKASARRLAVEAGVPVVPGQQIESDEELEQLAKQVGFPLLIKAIAGGGGKGMRVVRDPADLQHAFELARREAVASFNNPAMLIERLIERPRHIEVQILADNHGHCVFLGERECSIQRRHQKIIEECPSPAVDADLRQRIGSAAVAVARAAGYTNAGTVEFLLDENGDFYFLEVNTRLQVEHPITEEVTGIDLVHQQLRIADGLPLELEQDRIVIRGHAIEARVYAEDPARDFAPSPGRIHVLDEPHGPGVRVDSGVRAAMDVPVYYDPILSKVIAWAPTREAAIARLDRALADYVLLGFATNISLMRHVLGHPAFRQGQLSTGFITEHLLDRQTALWSAPLPSEQTEALAAALSADARVSSTDGAPQTVAAVRQTPWEQLANWRVR